MTNQEPSYSCDSAKPEVRIIFDILAAQGVKHIVCSPGSRNTPLLIAASCRKVFKKHIITDERAAAFVALGIAKASGKPTVLICTSGTALLNYAPAVAEAFHSGIPLIIISADRPMEWIDQDDSQTINQNGVFNNYIKGSYNIPSGRDDNDFLWYVNRVINEGFLKSISGEKGPVHFNIHLGNPLNETIPYNPSFQRVIERKFSYSNISNREIRELAERAAGKRILLVAGFLNPDHKLNKAVARFSAMGNVVLMAETVSNLHTEAHNYSIDSTLCHLSDNTREDIKPDIVITIGGALVSRMLKEYLRTTDIEQHWDIGYSDILADCFRRLNVKIEADPAIFLSRLGAELRKIPAPTDDTFKQRWNKLRDEAANLNNKILTTCEWSDLKAFGHILASLPKNANLFLSNGTSIRYAQLLSDSIPHAVYCNRGVSGIEGCTSTAIGTSLVSDRLSVLITGDMSASYDSGIFMTHIARKNMRVIVINNRGGAIFRFISTTRKLPQREEYFCLPSNASVKDIAESTGWRYLKASDEDELTESLRSFYAIDSAPVLLEIFTPDQYSADILRNLIQPHNKL